MLPVCVCVCYMDLVYAQVHAEEMQLVHEEKVAAERLARQSERVALQQSLELETARTNNGTLAQVWHTCSYSHCTCRLSYLRLNHMVKHKPFQINSANKGT